MPIQFSQEEKKCPRSVLLSAKQMVERFPQEASIHFLGPLLLKPLGSHQTVMGPLLGSLPLQQKLTLLRLSIILIAFLLTLRTHKVFKLLIAKMVEQILGCNFCQENRKKLWIVKGF